VALVALVVAFTFTTSGFLTTSNLLTILLQVSVVGIVAVPGAMLVLQGYVDLSVGAVAVLVAVVFGQLANVDHLGLAAAVFLSLLTGAAYGGLNGLLIARYQFSPIIVTLGGYAGARGLAEALAHDQTISAFGSTFAVLGNNTIVGVPVPAVIFLVVFVLGAYVWYETPAGRHMTAIGADIRAARAGAISVRRLPFVCYVLSGLAAGLGGLILTSELDGASVSIGVGLELQVLTAILLGGVAFSGGRGSLWGVLFGVLFIGTLDDGLILLNVGPYYSDLAVGCVLIAAAASDAFYVRLEALPVRVEGDQQPPGQGRSSIWRRINATRGAT
jgi:ribose transport system permease protein